MLHSSVGSSGDSPGSRRHGKDYREIYQEGVPASTVLVMERRFNNLNIRVAENCLCCISSARQPEAYFRVVHYGVHGIRTRESHGTKRLYYQEETSEGRITRSGSKGYACRQANAPSSDGTPARLSVCTPRCKAHVLPGDGPLLEAHRVPL